MTKMTDDPQFKALSADIDLICPEDTPPEVCRMVSQVLYSVYDKRSLAQVSDNFLSCVLRTELAAYRRCHPNE